MFPPLSSRVQQVSRARQAGIPFEEDLSIIIGITSAALSLSSSSAFLDTVESLTALSVSILFCGLSLPCFAFISLVLPLPLYFPTLSNFSFFLPLVLTVVLSSSPFLPLPLSPFLPLFSLQPPSRRLTFR